MVKPFKILSIHILRVVYAKNSTVMLLTFEFFIDTNVWYLHWKHWKLTWSQFENWKHLCEWITNLDGFMFLHVIREKNPLKPWNENTTWKLATIFCSIFTANQDRKCPYHANWKRKGECFFNKAYRKF